MRKPRGRHRSQGRRREFLGLLVALFCLTACVPQELPPWFPDLSGVLPSAATSTPPPEPTPTTELPPTPTVTPTPSSSVVTLSFWVPDILDPSSPATGASGLAAQVSRFDIASSGVAVGLQVKKGTGPGGLYDLLLTSHDVAPSVVPDLLVLNQDDLVSAAQEGLIQPLDDHLPADSGYFPAALSAVSTEEGLWAFPYVAQAEQMAYSPVLTPTAPITWTSVLSQGLSLVLPGAPPDGLAGDALLSMYVGEGGRVVDDRGQPALDRDALRQVYASLLDLIAVGLLDPAQVLALPDTESCWQVLLDGEAQLAPVSISTYWNTRPDTASLPDPEATSEPPQAVVHPTWVPTASGAPVTIMRTWGLAVTTDDPVRMEASLDLIRWLVSAQHMADLTSSSVVDPTRRPVVETWALPAQAEAFVIELLSNSVAPPSGGAEEIVRRALQAGLSALLQGDVLSADAAASLALSDLRR